MRGLWRDDTVFLQLLQSLFRRFIYHHYRNIRRLFFMPTQSVLAVRLGWTMYHNKMFSFSQSFIFVISDDTCWIYFSVRPWSCSVLLHFPHRCHSFLTQQHVSHVTHTSINNSVVRNQNTNLSLKCPSQSLTTVTHHYSDFKQLVRLWRCLICLRSWQFHMLINTQLIGCLCASFYQENDRLFMSQAWEPFGCIDATELGVFIRAFMAVCI